MPESIAEPQEKTSLGKRYWEDYLLNAGQKFPANRGGNIPNK
jgi:hypothetical protein